MQIEMEKMGLVEIKAAGILMNLCSQYQEELGFQDDLKDTVIGFNYNYGNVYAWDEWSSLCPYINMGATLHLGITTPYAGIEIDLLEYKNKQEMIEKVKAEHPDIHEEDIEYLEYIDASVWEWIYDFYREGKRLLNLDI